MPLIPALGRQRKADLCEFETSVVYRASSRTVKTVTQRNPVSKNQSINNNNNNNNNNNARELKLSMSLFRSERL